MMSLKKIGMKRIKSVSSEKGRRGIMVFDSPINRIIIRCNISLAIIDSLTFKKVKSVAEEKSYCASKRSVNTFLTPTRSFVKCYTILPPYNDLKLEKEIQINYYRPAYSIHTINEDSFITHHGSFVQVCSYKLGAVVKKIEIGDSMTWLKLILPSKSFENCVFLQLDGVKRCIRIFNHEKLELVRDFHIFKNTKFRGDIMCMDSYMNKKNHEIMIAGGKSLVLVIYNLIEDKLLEELSLFNFGDNDYFSILVLGEYFFVGDKHSNLGIYGLNKSTGKSKKIESRKVHGKGWIMEVRLYEKIGSDAKVVIVVDNGVSELWEFKGVFKNSFKERQQKEDFSERKEFLVFSGDVYLSRGDASLVVKDVCLVNSLNLLSHHVYVGKKEKQVEEFTMR